jgi:hypothetical protein
MGLFAEIFSSPYAHQKMIINVRSKLDNEDYSSYVSTVQGSKTLWVDLLAGSYVFEIIALRAVEDDNSVNQNCMAQF